MKCYFIYIYMYVWLFVFYLYLVLLMIGKKLLVDGERFVLYIEVYV